MKSILFLSLISILSRADLREVHQAGFDDGSMSERALMNHCYPKSKTLEKLEECIEDQYGTDGEEKIIKNEYPKSHYRRSDVELNKIFKSK